MTRWVTLSAPLLSAALLTGCGSSGSVKVTGRLLQGGAPYAVPDGQRIGLTLHAIEARDGSGKLVAGNEPFPAQVNPADGTFRVPGPEGYGVPPGKYRLALVRKLTRESLAKIEANPNPRSKRSEKRKASGPQGPDRETDLWNGQFSAEKSPIVRTLAGNGELVIDIDRPSE
jgi:hypothetical protein